MRVSRETKVLPPVCVSRETHERLLIFAALLTRWTPRVNLVARADVPRLWERHIQDSLQLLPLLSPASAGLDLGSGGGFPGLVLAIAGALRFDLVEADQRKAAFLREAARETDAAVTVHACRIEALTVTSKLITARALAPLSQLLPLVSPLLEAGGECLFHKGVRAEQELKLASANWQFDVNRFASASNPDGVILQIRGIMPRVGQQAV